MMMTVNRSNGVALPCAWLPAACCATVAGRCLDMPPAPIDAEQNTGIKIFLFPTLTAVSAVVPFFFFRWKGWL